MLAGTGAVSVRWKSSGIRGVQSLVNGVAVESVDETESGWEDGPSDGYSIPVTVPPFGPVSKEAVPGASPPEDVVGSAAEVDPVEPDGGAVSATSPPDEHDEAMTARRTSTAIGPVAELRTLFPSALVGLVSLLNERSWGCSTGLWRSLAARLLWEQEVVGSNPTSPT